MKNLFMVALIAIIPFTFAHAQTLDTSYPTVVTEKSEATGGYLFSDGKYLLYGDFIRHNGVTMPGIIKFNADGSVDNTFNIGTGPNASVEAVAVQGDGKILVGGRFSIFNGVARKILIRLNTDGSIDNTFNPNITLNNTGMAVTLLVQPDGKILFNGPVATADGVYTGSTLFRYNSNGTRDATFTGPSYAYQIRGMALQTDGKVVIGGSFTNGLARLASTGAADATFDVGTGFNGLVNDVKISSTNQIFVGGSFTTYKGVSAANFVCLTTGAVIDAAWPATGRPNGSVNDMHLLSDGKLLITGSFSSYNGTTSQRLARINTNGTIDATLVLGTGPNTGPESIHANATGDIIITGSGVLFTSFNGTPRASVAILQANGTLKAMTVQPNLQIDTWVRSIEAQGANKYLIGHFGSEVNATASAYFSRINLDGSLDGAFGGNGKPNAYVDAIKVDHNGKILIGGAFTTYNGTNTPRFARLSSEGVLETAFNTALGTGFNSNVNTIVEQPDGKLLVGGSFSTFNSVARRAVVRLNEDGTVDATFNTANGFSTSTSSTQIFDIELQGDGKILLSGEFNSFNGNAIKNIIRLNADGTYDNTFQIGAGVYSSSGSSSVNDVAILSNGKILAGGHFTNAGAGTNNVDYLVLLSSTGAVENGYDNNSFFIVEALEKQADGKIIVLDRNTGLRRLNADGSIDQTFTNVALEYWPEGIAFFSNSIIVGGRIATSDEKVVLGIAKYDFPAAAPTAPTSLATTAVAQTTIDLSWTHTGTTETGFFLERSVGNNTSYTVLATLPPNTTTYSNTGLTANTQYYYRVRAFNATGTTAYSNELSSTTLNTVPTAPSNFALTVISAGEIRLTWTDASANESGFEIYRSATNNTNYSLLTTTSTNVVNYADLSVVQGTLYYYKIRSVNNGGASGFSIERSANAVNPVPVAPTTLVLTSTNANTIELTWADNAFDEVDYVIERSPNTFSNYTEVAVVPANTTQYTDATATFAQYYWYRVRARNAVGLSNAAESAVTAGTFFMGNKTITTCQGSIYDTGYGGNYGNNENYTMKLLPSTPGASLQLVFSAFSTEVSDQFKIYNGGSITDPLIGTYSGTTSPGTIRATNPDGALTLVFTSNATTVSTGWAISLTCGIFPANPTNVQLTVPNMGEVKLDWTDNATNETGYIVERSLTGPTTDFTSLITMPANATSFSDNTVAVNTTYYYRVKAKGAQNDSEYTPVQGLAFGDGGIWRVKKDFDGIARTDAVAFAVGGKGYVGTGWAGGAQTANFRSYDAANDSWSTSVAGFGGSVRSEAAGFVVGSKAYVGTGEWLDPDNDLYEYDPVANTWTPKADFGGTARTGAIGFAIGNNGYFGFGKDAAGYTKDFWRYDATGNAWTRVADFPGEARNGAVVFVIGDYAYAGTGYTGTARLKDFYKYDPVANTWTAIATFPGLARRNAVAFAIDGKGYVGTGDSGSDKKDFFRYDPVSNTWQQVVNFGGSARSYAVAFAMNGKGYVSTGFDGADKKDLWEFTPATIEAAPVSPSGLVATGISSSQINLTWVDNSLNETGFVIERSKTNSISFEMVTTVATNATSYSDVGLDGGTTYYYRIKTITPTGSSPYSSNASAATLPLPPAAPTNLTATMFTALSIQLAWTDNPTTASAYVIERSAGDNSNYVLVNTVNSFSKSYTDSNIIYSTKYYYRLKATNTGGASPYSNEATITTGVPPLAAPTNLIAEVFSHSRIVLRWTDNSNNESTFRVLRSLTANGIFTVIALVNANVTEHADESVLPNTTYFYKVEASSSLGISPSLVTSAKTPVAPPAAPANLVATYDAALDNITLQWTDGSDNEDEFVIQKAFTANSFTDLIATTATTYVDEEPGTNFRVFYRVAAINSGGRSGYSNVAQIIITGIEDGEGITGVKTYPNPAIDKVTIEWTSADRGEVKLSLFDLAGRELKAARYEKNRQEFSEEVNLNDVAGNSILMMRMSIGQKVVTRKIVLK